MQIIETFGHYVENLTNTKPDSARWLLKTGWEAQNLKFHYMQDKRLMPADRHLANLMMDTMLRPIQKPEHRFPFLKNNTFKSVSFETFLSRRMCKNR